MLKPAHGLQAQRTADLPAGFDIPGLELLTQPEVMLDLINAKLPATATPFVDCAIVNLRFKTPTSCLITYEMKTPPDESGEMDSVYLYARGFGALEFAAAVPQLETTRWVDSQWGPAVSVLSEATAILYWFPNDERLHGLRRIAVHKKLQRMFYEHFTEYPSESWRISDRSIRLQVIRYKPERRIVMRCRFRAHRHTDNEKHERFVYLGVYEEGRDLYLWRLLTTLKALSAEGMSWTVPQPVAHVPEHGLLINAEATGVTMRSVFEDPDETGTADLLTRVAHSLSQLHAARVDGVPRQTNEDVITSLTDTRDRLFRFVPELSKRATELQSRLRERLGRMTSVTSHFVHGDLHAGQVIVGSGPVGYIDFDRAHAGDPVEDLGNFRAQAWLNYSPDHVNGLLDQWLDTYRSQGTIAITEDALNTWTAVSLYQSALRPIGRLQPNWRGTVDATLDLAEAVLG